jgi:ABC-type transporter Mla MlaB component
MRFARERRLTFKRRGYVAALRGPAAWRLLSNHQKNPESTRRAMADQRRSVTVEVPCPLARAELTALFARTCAQLARHPRCELLLCEVGGIAADAVAVDALARLALVARRRRCEVRLRDASPQLLELVELAGLADVLRRELPR